MHFHLWVIINPHWFSNEGLLHYIDSKIQNVHTKTYHTFQNNAMQKSHFGLWTPPQIANTDKENIAVMTQSLIG